MIGFIQGNNSVVETISTETQAKVVKTVINQDSPHPSRSDRYSLVKTSDLISMFEAEGFRWKLVAEERSRKASYKGYGSHMIRLEAPEILSGDSIIDNELKPVLYLRNSYHGRTRLRLDLGFFRFACMNGLFVGQSLRSFNKKHIGISQAQIQSVFSEMKDAFTQAVPVLKSLMEKEISREQQLDMAKTILAERMRLSDNYVEGQHEKLLTVQREEDVGNTVWKVMNRIQENLGLNFNSRPVEMSYTVNVQDKDGVVQQKERTLRRISGISEIAHLNKSLFDLAVSVSNS